MTAENVRFKCSSASCGCSHFFFVVAEGAWILRCRCKHKHVEHDCTAPPFKCKKPRCACNGFDRCDTTRPGTTRHDPIPAMYLLLCLVCQSVSSAKTRPMVARWRSLSFSPSYLIYVVLVRVVCCAV